jgi:hypothetical protein
MSSTRLGVAVLVTAALAGCTAKEASRDSVRADSASAGGTSPTPANSLAATPPSAALPGALTKPIDQYTGDEFYQFVQQLRWGGGVERERQCKGNPGCDGENPARLTRVRVDAVDGQDSISAATVPANGVVAVRAINRGDLVEDRYGFKPERKFEYYMLVLPGAGPNGTWRFEELDTTPGARRHTLLARGTFKPCNHPYRPGRVNRVNFWTCDGSYAADSVQRSNLMLFAPPKDPVWIDCAAGCCIAD